MSKKQQRKLDAQWKSVDQLLVAMKKDAQVCSLVDMEVGAFGLLTTMNEIRTDHNVRPLRLSDESIGKLCEAALEVSRASVTVGTSTAVQTTVVALLRTLIEAEMKQDEERLPEIIAELRSRCDATGRVIREPSGGVSEQLLAI